MPKPPTKSLLVREPWAMIHHDGLSSFWSLWSESLPSADSAGSECLVQNQTIDILTWKIRMIKEQEQHIDLVVTWNSIFLVLANIPMGHTLHHNMGFRDKVNGIKTVANRGCLSFLTHFFDPTAGCDGWLDRVDKGMVDQAGCGVGVPNPWGFCFQWFD